MDIQTYMTQTRPYMYRLPPHPHPTRTPQVSVRRLGLYLASLAGVPRATMEGTLHHLDDHIHSLKVDGVAAWVHCLHVRPVDPFACKEDYGDGWEASQHPTNPLKIPLKCHS